MEKTMIIRTVVLFIALLNQVLVMFNLSPLPFTSDEIEHGVTALFTTIITLWAWWKNNSITSEAIEADKYMRQLKDRDKTV